MLSKMLTECLDSMEKAACSFQPELRHLRSQLKNMEITDELQLLVAYLKQSPKLFHLRSRSAWSVVRQKVSISRGFRSSVLFYGVISLPLLSFVVSESHDARELYDRKHWRSAEKGWIGAYATRLATLPRLEKC
ncbi:hypothetical protein GQ600_8910 [Phytophthora cactorum]|nr:hypothetical protein GQ600_8910 [Phytophthora cactorum]